MSEIAFPIYNVGHEKGQSLTLCVTLPLKPAQEVYFTQEKRKPIGAMKQITAKGGKEIVLPVVVVTRYIIMQICIQSTWQTALRKMLRDSL